MPEFDNELATGDQGVFELGDDNDEIQMDDDEYDPEAEDFLKEVQTKKEAPKSIEKPTKNWFGNGIGSGKYQAEKEKINKEIARKVSNVGLQPSREEPNKKPIPWGFNAQPKPKEEVNQELMKQKQEEARQRFEELQADKKSKLEAANPSVKVHMGLMAQV